MNNVKTPGDDLDIDKLKTFPVGSKKLSNVEDNEIAKSANFNTLKAKLNSLGEKIPDATTLIQINPYNTDQQNFEKKILEMLIKKIPAKQAHFLSKTHFDNKLTSFNKQIT